MHIQICASLSLKGDSHSISTYYWFFWMWINKEAIYWILWFKLLSIKVHLFLYRFQTAANGNDKAKTEKNIRKLKKRTNIYYLFEFKFKVNESKCIQFFFFDLFFVRVGHFYFIFLWLAILATEFKSLFSFSFHWLAQDYKTGKTSLWKTWPCHDFVDTYTVQINLPKNATVWA